jgi:two-component system LytT family sensor kinase
MCWWAIWMAAQAMVLVGQGFDWNTSMTDAVITQLVFAAAGYTINTSMHSYQPGARNSLYILVWSVALAGFCVFIQRWILLQLIWGNADYKTFLEDTLVLRGAFGWLMITLVATLTWFWVYVTEHHESEKRKDDAIQLAREAELSNLRQQLQPHFLFNSLNSISALAGTNPNEARKMIQQLSDFLRGTIRKDNKTLVTLEEELRHLQLYLDIEKVRFGHRLATKITKTEESLSMNLPALILQPIVENAIKFGLYDTVGEIVISVSVWKENGLLFLQVGNPFDPITAVRKQGTGFGLSSIRRRLYLLYFRDDLLSTSREGTTFITTICIPQNL